MNYLKHISHKHQLLLCEEGNDHGLAAEAVRFGGSGSVSAGTTSSLSIHGGEKELLCPGCLESISSLPFYTCTDCNFYLHKSCAESPEEMVSFLHPRHPLTLLVKNKYGLDAGCICDHCDEIVLGFTYNCSLCKFDLDLKCALRQPRSGVEHEGDHKHSFMLLRPTSFTCDACGEQSINSISCLCKICQLQVHQTCTSWPPLVKIMGHNHQLILASSIDPSADDSNHHKNFCEICHGKVNTEFSFYSCGSCTYIAHVSCATREDLRDVAFQPIKDECEEHNNSLSQAPVPEEEPNVGLISKDVKEEFSLGVGEDQIVTGLNHFSHQHRLTLVKHDLKDYEVCDGCARSILVAPFYSCDKCNFFLHQRCSELPHKILHPLHSSHTLTLLAKAPHNNFGLFECNVCHMYCNGFIYMCDECKFYLDVVCGSYHNTLSHKSHNHMLNLIHENTDTECDACGLHAKTKFSCGRCNFNLDLRCASLSYTITHECPKLDWDPQPLHLYYYSPGTSLGDEFYCDYCEERRGKYQWFYYCKDCDYSTHPLCHHDRYNIKCGGTFKSHGHPHPLTLLRRSTKPYPICPICKEFCKDFLLYCAKCDYGIHLHWFKCFR